MEQPSQKLLDKTGKTPETRKKKVPTPCPMCGYLETDLIEALVLRSLSEDADVAGWKVGVEFAVEYCSHNMCTNCGNMFNVIEKSIPIRISNKGCPICG